MKKITLTISFIFLVSAAIIAQEIIKVPDFGKIDMPELQMKECSFEPGEPAINLLKYEDVTLTVDDNNYTQVVTTIRYRVKIFKAAGFKYATVIIPYDKTSKISNIQANTYNLDEKGQQVVSNITESDIYKDKAKKSDNDKSIRFTLPNVKEGSVIEYQYTRTEREEYSIPSWYFQSNIPNLLSACKISSPVFSQIQKRIIADLPVEEGSMVDDHKGFDKRALEISYAMRNVPAFKYEPFMSSSRDYKYRVDFLVNPRETVKEANIRHSDNKWEVINSRFLGSGLFGYQFVADIPTAKKFLDSTKKLSQTSEKVNAVYEYVKKNIKWNNEYFILSWDLADVWKDKEGNSAEINLSILNLLRKCGVDCYPVLLSTRAHGKTDYTFPAISQFNTVDILVLDSNNIYILDGTNPYLSYQVPPLNVMNCMGMIVDFANNKWITLNFDDKLIRDSVSVVATVDSTGIMKGNVLKSYYDLAKIEKLQSDKEDDDEDDNTVTESEIKIDTSYQLNKDNNLLPLVEHTKFHYEIPVTNEFYFLNPFLFFNLSKNPFTDTARKSDIDFGANTIYTVHMEIALPEEIKLEELTKNKEIRSADSSIYFKYTNYFKNDTIYINNTMEINQAIFDKEDYPVIKKFFDNIYSLLNNQILLKRKDEE